jgi:hypothetical protein
MSSAAARESSSPQPLSGDFEDLSISPDPLTATSLGLAPERKARLLFCKSHVSIHPTAFPRDNITGHLGVVLVDKVEVPASAEMGKEEDEDGVKVDVNKEVLVFWVPNQLLDRMDEADKDGFRKVEGRSGASEDEDGELDAGSAYGM